MGHDEVVAGVFVDLGALVWGVVVIDRQWMEAELLRQEVDLLAGGIEAVEPHDGLRLSDQVADRAQVRDGALSFLRLVYCECQHLNLECGSGVSRQSFRFPGRKPKRKLRPETSLPHSKSLLRVPGDFDHARPDYLVAQGVASLELLHNGVVGIIVGVRPHHRFVDAGIELLSDRLDRLDALLLEEVLKLTQDQDDAAVQGIEVADLLGSLDRPVEVVEDRQQADDEIL